jgi:hypothetical protein
MSSMLSTSRGANSAFVLRMFASVSRIFLARAFSADLRLESLFEISSACVSLQIMLSRNLGRQGGELTHQFLAFVSFGPHCFEPLPCRLLFTIALLVQALERRIEPLLKVMYWLILMLEGLDAKVKAALPDFDVGVVPLGFHVFHKWKYEVHESDLRLLYSV